MGWEVKFNSYLDGWPTWKLVLGENLRKRNGGRETVKKNKIEKNRESFLCVEKMYLHYIYHYSLIIIHVFRSNCVRETEPCTAALPDCSTPPAGT